MYEVRNIKGHATHDGYSFVASLYEDGRKIGTVENAGRGGCNVYVFEDGFGRNSAHYLALKATAIANGHDDSYGEAEDSLIADLLDRVEVSKTLKRHAKTKLLFVLDDENPYDVDAGFRYLGGNAVQFREKAIEHLHSKYAGHRVRVYDVATNEFVEA